MTQQKTKRVALSVQKPRWAEWMRLGAEAAAILMDLRDKPRALDWMAVGVRAAGLAAKLREEHRAATAGDPDDYFECDGPEAEWKLVPGELTDILLEYVEETALVESHHDGRMTSMQAILGRVDAHPVGWVAYADGSMSSGPYIRRADEAALWRALGGRLWSRLDCEHAAYGREGLCADPFMTGERDLQPTKQFRDLHGRLEAFVDHGISRSVLFCGPPGTGKSTGIRGLARAMGMSSLRVDVGAFMDGWGAWRSHDSAIEGIDTLVRVLAPEVIILDDIDRAMVTARLLEFLEFAHDHATLVLASANQTGAMAGAALRPGRFDELVRVDALDRDLLESLLGDEAGLVDELASWPVAYVHEFVQRRRVLGPEVARREIAELAARIARTSEDDDD